MGFLDRPIYVEDVILVASVLLNLALALALFLVIVNEDRRRSRQWERVQRGENLRNPVYGTPNKPGGT